MAHQITLVDCELRELLYKTFITPVRPDYIKVDGVVLPEYYKEFADRIENFEIRNDDIWICTFPKSGTTWTQEMIWCIVNNLDFEKAKVPLLNRFPFLELSSLIDIRNVGPDYYLDDETKFAAEDSITYTEKLPGQRFIKTHLPFHLLPRELRNGEKNPKIICVTRNPKDTCISYYHHCRLLEEYRGNFEEFCRLFLGDTLTYCPYWGNVLGYWEQSVQENILFLKFEDMRKDLSSVIKRTATFLGKDLTNGQVSTLSEHLSFASMKANPAVNNEAIIQQIKMYKENDIDGAFIRSGEIGQWKTDMSPEIIEEFDNWTRDNLRGINFQF